MKQDLSQKAIVGISAVAVIVIGVLVFYFIRRSDPAAAGPQPFVPFDRAAHAAQMGPATPPDMGPKGGGASGGPTGTSGGPGGGPRPYSNAPASGGTGP